MLDEAKEVPSIETGWIAFCMTFAGATVGPLIAVATGGILVETFLPGKDSFLGFLLFGAPITMVVGFVCGAYGGNWLGKKLAKFLYKRKG
jgi:hypothetical protein